MASAKVYPNSLTAPPTIESAVRAVVERFDALEAMSTRQMRTGHSVMDHLSVTERPAVVGVFGEHGSGKSTLLRFACAELDTRDDRVVLPIVSPERFAPGDTLFGWVLAGLRAVLLRRGDLAERLVEVRGNPMSVAQHVDLLTRQEALARSDFKEQTPPAIFSPDEWAEGLAAVTAAGLDLVEGWNALLETLTSRDSDCAAAVKLLVVPVDDADQAPMALHSIMRDLRWVTTHPAVGAVLCASHGTLLEVLRTSPEFSALSEATASRQAREVVLKVLPRDLRVMVELLRPSERLAFTPLGGKDTLASVLSRFQLPGTPPLRLRTLGDYFATDVAGTLEPSDYADMLSPIPRQLEQLWRGLDAISGTGDLTEATRQAALMVLERAVEPHGSSEGELPADTIALDRDDVRIDYTALDFGIAQGRGVVISRTEDHSIGVRTIRGFGMERAAPDTKVDPDNVRDPTDFPKHLVFAHHFLRDIGDQVVLAQPVLGPLAYYGSPPLPGGRNWNVTVEVRHKGASTDNAFLPIPPWDSMYDTLVFTAGWNAVIESLFRGQTLDLAQLAGSATALEWVIVSHVRLVIAVQRQRVIPSELIPHDLGDIAKIASSWDRQRELARVRDELEYPSGDSHSVRAADFDVWFEQYLPWASDRIFCPADLSVDLLALRDEMITKAGRRDEANRRAAEGLTTRLHRQLGAAWIGTTIELLRGFDAEKAADIAAAHEVARERDQAETRTFARALQERGVPPDLVGRLLISGVTQDVALQLQALGMAQEAIEVLAQRFPPPTSTGAAPSVEDKA